MNEQSKTSGRRFLKQAAAFSTLPFFLTILSALNSCSPAKIMREQIEWSDFWWTNEPEKSKPRVLFIGNSICRGYFNSVSSRLSDKVNCDRYSTSRSVEDPAFFKETRLAMGRYNHVIIHFNNGLHGWHLTNEKYREGLEKYVKFLMAKKSKDCILVFSTTTPYPSKEQGIKLDEQNNRIVIERNLIAAEIMKKYKIPVIDLYAVMEPELDKYSISKGDLHYNKEGNERLAEKISQAILLLLRQ
jgi:hypothetical protein